MVGANFKNDIFHPPLSFFMAGKDIQLDFPLHNCFSPRCCQILLKRIDDILNRTYFVNGTNQQFEVLHDFRNLFHKFNGVDKVGFAASVA